MNASLPTILFSYFKILCSKWSFGASSSCKLVELKPWEKLLQQTYFENWLKMDRNIFVSMYGFVFWTSQVRKSFSAIFRYKSPRPWSDRRLSLKKQTAIFRVRSQTRISESMFVVNVEQHLNYNKLLLVGWRKSLNYQISKFD